MKNRRSRSVGPAGETRSASSRRILPERDDNPPPPVYNPCCSDRQNSRSGKGGGNLRFLKRIFDFLLGIIRFVVWAVGLAVLAGFFYFYVAERPLPHETLNRLLNALSTDTDALDARRAFLGPRLGLNLQKVRLLTKGVVAPAWFTADELRLSGRIRPDQSPRDWIDHVIAHRVNLASLPPELTNTTSSTAPITFSPMRLDLVDATFLGMRFKRIRGFLHQEKGVVVLDDAQVEWPSESGSEEAAGTVRYDPVTGLVEGKISGHLIPERIYPLLHLLEANGVLNIAHRFAFGVKTVEADASFRIASTQEELRISLAVADCIYDGVPIRRAKAVIVAKGSNNLDQVSVQQLVCERPDGSRLTGDMTIDTIASNIDFAAQANMPSEPLLRIVRVNIKPEKYGIIFDVPPQVTATGRVPLDGSLEGIRITGTMIAPTVTVRRVPLQNFRCDFGIAPNNYILQNVRATTAGGELSGSMHMMIPPDAETQATYRTTLQIEHLDLETFAALYGITNRNGTAKVTMELASNFGESHERNLNGHGDFHLESASLGRIPLFAGLTDYMRRNVPGIDPLINLSEASVPFAISNGVLRSDHVLVEGDVFSIHGAGAYSIPEDNLDFNVRTTIFKSRNWMGKLFQIVTFPFSKLLLEFRVRGPVETPVWDYRGVIDRIMDTVGGKKDSAP